MTSMTGRHRQLANATLDLQVVEPTDAGTIGNALVQAPDRGHLDDLEKAGEVARLSLNPKTLVPIATAWDTTFDRLAQLCPA
jgi:hypothetical protein